MPRKPVLIDLETAPSPAEAPPVPDALPAPGAMRGVAVAAGARGTVLGRLARWVFGAFASFVLSVALWDFVTGLLATNTVLGSVALGLTAAAVLMLSLLAWRELAAYSRLARLDHLRIRVEKAAAAPLREAQAAASAVEALYAARPDLAWARARVKDRREGVLDADAWLSLTEAGLMGLLDQAARREIEGAARQVATVTALVPLALADVAMALFANLRMVRRLAEIYGGRSGAFGGWRLLRRVFSHLVATGALALTDDLIGSVAGGGIVSRLSRRFGEGVVNGALTARVGVAAMEVCRPMPFVALPRPKVSNLVSRALTGVFDRADAKES